MSTMYKEFLHITKGNKDSTRYCTKKDIASKNGLHIIRHQGNLNNNHNMIPLYIQENGLKKVLIDCFPRIAKDIQLPELSSTAGHTINWHNHVGNSVAISTTSY